MEASFFKEETLKRDNVRVEDNELCFISIFFLILILFWDLGLVLV